MENNSERFVFHLPDNSMHSLLTARQNLGESIAKSLVQTSPGSSVRVQNRIANLKALTLDLIPKALSFDPFRSCLDHRAQVPPAQREGYALTVPTYSDAPLPTRHIPIAHKNSFRVQCHLIIVRFARCATPHRNETKNRVIRVMGLRDDEQLKRCPQLQRSLNRCMSNIRANGKLTDVWSVDLKVDITNVTLTGNLLNPKYEFNITVPETHYSGVVESFTYTGSVERLWNFATENDFIWFQFSKVAWTSQTAAVILALFSGVWPHAKLIALHLLWYVPIKSKARSRALYWFGFFGKYSMLDVFVVCYLVVLVQLRIDLPAETLAYNLGTGLPGFLDSLNSTTLVHGFCEGLFEGHFIHHIHDCLDIGKLLIEDTNVRDRILHDFVEHVHETGDVFVQLAAQSQPGIYFYSSGVWLSLVISLVVDVFDDRVRHHDESDSHGGSGEFATPMKKSWDSGVKEEPLEQPLLDPVSAEGKVASNKARTISVGMVIPDVTISHRTISAGVVILEGDENDLLVIPEETSGRTTSSSRNIAYDFNKDFMEQEEEFTEAVDPPPPLFSPSPVAKEELDQKDNKYEILLAKSGYLSLVVLILLGGAGFTTDFGIELNTQHVELPGEIGMIFNMLYAAPNNTVFMSRDFSLGYVLHQVEEGTASATNRFLAKDFLIFGFIGPISLLVVAFLLCVLPLKTTHQWALLQLLKFATGFAAWDVLVIAHLLLLLEMPSLTTGMVTVESNNAGVYFCDLMYNSFQPNVYPCFEETFTFVMPAWVLIPLAAVLQACVSWLIVTLTERRLTSRLCEPPPLVVIFSPPRF